MKILEMESVEEFSMEMLTDQIKQLILLNRMDGDIRIRLQVFRRAGGYYIPNQNASDYLMIAFPMKWQPYSIKSKASIAQSVHTVYQSFSFCKTGSAMTYVKAGLEMKNRHLDEIIITDGDGFISEASSSNIFWIKENKLFTPSLETGCINGVRRRWIIDEMKKMGNPVMQVKAPLSELLKSDYIFTSNSAGIHFIKSIDDTEFLTPNISKPPAFLADLLVP